MIDPKLELNLFECILIDRFCVESAFSYRSRHILNLVPNLMFVRYQNEKSQTVF